MTPDPKLEADLRALGAAVKPSAGFAERVTAAADRAPSPRGRMVVRQLALTAAVLLAGGVGAYLMTKPKQRPGEVARGEFQRPTNEPPTPPPAPAYSLAPLVYENSKWGFIDTAGKVVIPARHSRVDGFAEGLAPVKVGGTHAAGGLWGFVDRTGKEVIPPRYEWARPFRDGLAPVQVGTKWGFIDRAGKLVVMPRFESVERFSEGLAAVRDGGLWGFIGPDGEYRIRPQFGVADSFSEGLAAVHDPVRGGGRSPWRYIDPTGRVVFELPADFEYAGGFTEERAAVSRNGSWGLIDRSGRVVVEPRYSYVGGFEGGRARVSVRRSVKVNGVVRTAGTKSGTIAADGTELGPLLPDYDEGVEIDPATGRLSAVELNEQLEPVRVTDIDFARLRPRAGLYRVSAPKMIEKVTAHTVGFVDRAGKMVIPPTLEDAGEFAEGLAPFAVGLDWTAIGRAAERKGQ